MLVPLHHHLKFFIDLRVFGLGARGKIVFDCIGFRTLRRHGTLMFLLVERLQVSADRFTWPHRPRALNLHMHVNLTPRGARFLFYSRFTLAITFHAGKGKKNNKKGKKKGRLHRSHQNQTASNKRRHVLVLERPVAREYLRSVACFLHNCTKIQGTIERNLQKKKEAEN